MTFKLNINKQAINKQMALPLEFKLLRVGRTSLSLNVITMRLG